MLFESLESRSLLSASAFTSQVVTDQLNVRAALMKFRYDVLTNTATVSADRDALESDGLANDAILAPLFAKIHSESKALQHTVALDDLAESSAVLKAESVVTKAIGKYVLDDSNESERTADRKVIREDRIQLEDAEIAGLNNRLAVREAEVSTLTDQLNAITTALATDTGASSQLHADVAKFVTDAMSYSNTLITDLHSIIAARTKLTADLNASLTVST